MQVPYLLFHMESEKGPVEKGRYASTNGTSMYKLLFFAGYSVFLILVLLSYSYYHVPFNFFSLQLLQGFAFSCCV